MNRLTAPWLSLPGLKRLFSLAAQEGATLRLVGGCVRDGLLGLPVSDIDFAINRDPHWVMDLLTKNKIKVFPTGIEHGTVTAVIDKHPFQITALRVDVKTFGRKAEVSFTEDWIQDALRRDFTMNAIYADQDGKLFDPVGGLNDLEARRVKFIGQASQRIQEDYLRILRFFRFSARFGHEPYDEEGLAACAKYASHLPHLARERVTEEFLKLMALRSPLYALRAMHETGVLTYILHPGTWEDLISLVALEHAAGLTPSALLRLAAFHPALEEIHQHLRLSKAQHSAIAFYLKGHHFITIDSFKIEAYRWGKDRVLSMALLQTAQRIRAELASLTEGLDFLKSLHQTYDTWEVPVFPLKGSDVLALGVKQGHKVGSLLEKVESWWISQDLEPDRKQCLAYLSSLC